MLLAMEITMAQHIQRVVMRRMWKTKRRMRMMKGQRGKMKRGMKRRGMRERTTLEVTMRRDRV
jgi:hypothetical protein